MHPFLRNQTQLLIYLLLWLPVVSYIARLLVVSSPGWPLREAVVVSLLLCLELAFLFLSLFYVCRALPLKQTSLAVLLPSHAAAILVASTLWLVTAGLMAGILDRIAEESFRLMQVQNATPELMPLAVITLSLAQAVNYLLLSLEDQREAERRQEHMRTLAREAELRSLRAQINPHFLFNSLNSVSALTASNPERAREMCLLLADFFRRNLDVGNQESTTIGEEVDLVFHYLQIEMARFGKRLQLDMDIPDSLRAFSVPPLILQPLVENAVKHGIAGLVEGGTVSIKARPLSGGGVMLTVENPYDPDQPRRRRKGIGIDNVRSRLEMRYGQDARFELQREEGSFRAKIQILDAPSAASSVSPAQAPPTKRTQEA
ncbi:MAG: histidine kinase [Bryobacterales bacterium]|nr:histidine kinase [Bryobacterales bacterium]